MKHRTKTLLFVGMNLFGLTITTINAINAGSELGSLTEMHKAELNYSDASKKDIQITYLKKYAKALMPVAIPFTLTAASSVLLAKSSISNAEKLLTCLAFAKTELSSVDVKDRAGFKMLRIDDRKRPLKSSKDEIFVYEEWTDQLIKTTPKKLDKALDRANKKLQNSYVVRMSSILRDIGGRASDLSDMLTWEMENEAQMEIWKKTGGPVIDICLNDIYEVDGKDVSLIRWTVPPGVCS